MLGFTKLVIILLAIIIVILIGLSSYYLVTQCTTSEAPTLKLERYDGPDYSESDNIY